MDVEAGGRGLGEETTAIEGDVGVGALGMIGGLGDSLDAGFFITEVEVDGLDLLSGSEVQLEVGAEGIDGHVGAGVVEGVACSEIEDVAVGTGEWFGIVGAYEADA